MLSRQGDSSKRHHEVAQAHNLPYIARQMKTDVKRTLITGLVVTTPVFVTIWIISLLFGLINTTVTPVILQILKLLTFGQLSDATWVTYVAPIVSITLSVVFVYLMGLIGGNVLGKQLLGVLDRSMKRIPFVRGIYSATRQFVDTFQSGGGAFSHVVLLQYPRLGVYTLGFVTSSVRGEAQEKTGKELVCVFVPTTPNPTSGFLLFVPPAELVRLSMSVDDAFKMIISGGVLAPGREPTGIAAKSEGSATSY